MTKEDLMQIQELMHAELTKELAPIRAQLEEVNERLDRLEESAEITRTATNELCKWAENVAIIPAVNVKFPTN